MKSKKGYPKIKNIVPLNAPGCQKVAVLIFLGRFWRPCEIQGCPEGPLKSIFNIKNLTFGESRSGPISNIGFEQPPTPILRHFWWFWHRYWHDFSLFLVSFLQLLWIVFKRMFGVFYVDCDWILFDSYISFWCFQQRVLSLSSFAPSENNRYRGPVSFLGINFYPFFNPQRAQVSVFIFFLPTLYPSKIQQILIMSILQPPARPSLSFHFCLPTLYPSKI